MISKTSVLIAAATIVLVAVGALFLANVFFPGDGPKRESVPEDFYPWSRRASTLW